MCVCVCVCVWGDVCVGMCLVCVCVCACVMIRCKMVSSQPINQKSGQLINHPLYTTQGGFRACSFHTLLLAHSANTDTYWLSFHDMSSRYNPPHTHTHSTSALRYTYACVCVCALYLPTAWITLGRNWPSAMSLRSVIVSE